MEIRGLMILLIKFDTTVKIQHVEATRYSVQVITYRLARNVFAHILSSDQVFLYHALHILQFSENTVMRMYVYFTDMKEMLEQSIIDVYAKHD